MNISDTEAAMAHHAWNPNCKVYVGGLKEEANKYDLEDAFGKIGKVSEGKKAKKNFTNQLICFWHHAQFASVHKSLFCAAVNLCN